MTRLLLLTLTALALHGQSGLEEIRKDPDLERRFESSLAFSDEAMRRSRRVVSESGTVSELRAALEDVAGGAEAALEALRATGKTPRKLGKQYKKGEVRTRDFVRQLEQLAPAISLDFRAPAEEAKDRVARIHEAFLEGVMSKK
jgi:hypothetical protein